MRKLWVLMRLNFRALLVTFSFGRGKKRAASGIGALAFMGFLAIYMSGVYSAAFGAMLREVGLLSFLLPLMSILACGVALAFTLFAASGIVFGSKDSDLMLSLPVSAFSVMLSKLLALYLENLVFCVLWLIPTGVSYLMQGGNGGFLFMVRLVLSALFLPFIPTLLGMLLGYCISYISSHLRKKALLSNILYLGTFSVFFVLLMQINRLSAILLENKEQFEHLLRTWLLPFGLMTQGLDGNLLALLFFAILCFAPFLALAWLFSTQYKKILSGLSNHTTRNDFKLQSIKTQGQFAALFKKETARYFGSSIYVFNTGFGVVMLVGAAIAGIFFKNDVNLIVAQMGGVEEVIPMLAAGVCFILSTVCTTCVSISLEGKTLWILKESPVSAATLFGSKALLNIAISAFGAFVSIFIITVTYGVPLFSAAIVLLLAISLAVLIALMGLIINLLLPKMDADNDTLVVKQSASSMCGIFFGMILAGLGALIYVGLNEFITFDVFGIAACIFLLAASAASWQWLKTKGAQRLIQL